MGKIFTNDKFFLATVIIAIIGTAFFDGVYLFVYPGRILTKIIGFLIAVCILVLYLSYKRHSKNVMKGMMSAVLMAQLICEINYMLTPSLPSDRFFSIVFVILAVCLFINHFLINDTHKASPVNIKINQIIVILFAISSILCNAFWIPLSTSALEIVANIVYIIAFPCVMATVVCVESRLDAYRIDREAAGWTEEAGYPEGYVHEYQKNQK